MAWDRRGRLSRASPEVVELCEKMTAESMYSMRNKGNYGLTRTFGIMCQGKRHKITIRQRGPVTLENHSIKEELIMMRLGDGGKPRCLEFLDEWAKKGMRYYRNYVTIKSTSHKIPQDMRSLQCAWREKRHELRHPIDILADIKVWERLLRRIDLWHEDIESRIRKQFAPKNDHTNSDLPKELFPTKIHASFTSKFSPNEGDE